MLDTLHTKLKSSQFLLAAVLPLSGKLSSFANDVLSGVQLAVEILRSGGPSSIGLLVKDADSSQASFLDDFSSLWPQTVPSLLSVHCYQKTCPSCRSWLEMLHTPLLTPTAGMLPNVRRLGSYTFNRTHLSTARRAFSPHTPRATGIPPLLVFLHPDTPTGAKWRGLIAERSQAAGWRDHRHRVLQGRRFRRGRRS